MALRQPEALAGLVLMSGYYRPTVRLDAALAAGPAAPVIGDVARFTVSPLLSRLLTPLILRQIFAPAPTTEAFRADYPLSQSLRPWQLRASAAEAGLMRREAAALSPALTKLAIPTLLIAGRDDKLISFAHQTEWLARRLPDAQLVAIPGAGHMVHHTAPEQVVSAIARFRPPQALRSVPRPQAFALPAV
jgi:pimeloyl-ACP methyl ester carboxylesterase